ncbi:MAG: hypothetical protein JXB25_09735 [Deltaproteobacteria bacterium]|nr:hypothetical protein [Deltaproteobacteria bacterium]
MQQKRLPKGDEKNQEEEEGIVLLDIVSQPMATMQNTIARLKLATYSPDVAISISKAACTFLDFHRADEMIRLGYHQAGVTMESFLAESGGQPNKNRTLAWTTTCSSNKPSCLALNPFLHGWSRALSPVAFRPLQAPH